MAGTIVVDTLKEQGNKEVTTVKVWARWGAAPALEADFNITSITDHGTGDFSFTLGITFGTASYYTLGGLAD